MIDFASCRRRAWPEPPADIPQTFGMMAATIAGQEGLRAEAPDPDLLPQSLERMP